MIHFRVPASIHALVDCILDAAENAGMLSEDVWAEQEALRDAWRKLLTSEISKDWPA